MSYQCIQCSRDLNPEITGMHPFWDGYICNRCRELADEEFCNAVDEYDTPPPKDTISNEELLKFIEHGRDVEERRGRHNAIMELLLEAHPGKNLSEVLKELGLVDQFGHNYEKSETAQQ